MSKDNRRVTSFTEHLVTRNFDGYNARVFATGLFEYAKSYGVNSITIIDFQGMLAAIKDIAYVIYQATCMPSSALLDTNSHRAK
ncbi:hypothetical protein EON65_21525 [archaeon]|nr:MAG: hypothetical protein EON65_21525 [archaeon]